MASGALRVLNFPLRRLQGVFNGNRDRLDLEIQAAEYAAGRLTGTVLSGWVYQTQGLTGCLWWSMAFVLAAALLSFRLPPVEPATSTGRPGQA